MVAINGEVHVGMALGMAMGVACCEKIGYHIKNPYHFSFQRYYMKINVFIVSIQSLMHLSNLIPRLALQLSCGESLVSLFRAMELRMARLIRIPAHTLHM